MSTPIKHRPSTRILCTNLQAFALLLCCLGGAFGFIGSNTAVHDNLVSGAAHSTPANPLAPGQAHVIDATHNALLSSRQWGSGQTRLTASTAPGSDSVDGADHLLADSGDHLIGDIFHAQGYAPGTLLSIPSFYRTTWSPRSPPVAS